MTGFDEIDDELLAVGLLPEASDDLDEDDLNDALDEDSGLFVHYRLTVDKGQEQVRIDK